MPCDYSKYPKDWKEIRKRILERDGHCCKICKVKNGVYVFRGYRNGEEIFQDSYGSIYKTDTGELIDTDYFADILPLSGKPDQKAIKIVLTIAHLNHDAADNRDENLAALCQLHHNRYDIEFRKKNRKKSNKKKKKLIDLF